MPFTGVKECQKGIHVHSWLTIERTGIIRQVPGNSRTNMARESEHQQPQPAPSFPCRRVPYRGRIAPTPSGWLHLGHASTFHTAWKRARESGGCILYRTEDLDPFRCRSEYACGAMEDLRWWGLDWDEGPDVGGGWGPYVQSARMEGFREAFKRLVEAGHIYESPHSRRQIREAEPIPSPVNDDPIFPPALRQPVQTTIGNPQPDTIYRFRVPDGREVTFEDGRLGKQCFVAGQDFGDFIIWKKDGCPAYELAVVVDDHAMEISEVVRGEDLLLATARQLLLYEALGWSPPAWYHCPLVEDPLTNHRMSKTRQSLALRTLREAGHSPGQPPESYFGQSKD